MDPCAATRTFSRRTCCCNRASGIRAALRSAIHGYGRPVPPHPQPVQRRPRGRASQRAADGRAGGKAAAGRDPRAGERGRRARRAGRAARPPRQRDGSRDRRRLQPDPGDAKPRRIGPAAAGRHHQGHHRSRAHRRRGRKARPHRRESLRRSTGRRTATARSSTWGDVVAGMVHGALDAFARLDVELALEIARATGWSTRSTRRSSASASPS